MPKSRPCAPASSDATPASSSGRTHIVGVVLACATLVGLGRAAPSPLEGRNTLVAAYDATLNADFETATSLLRRCVDAPAVGCAVIDVLGLWWRIQLDPHSRALDGLFLTRVNETIAAAESWTTRGPKRAEAWFYLGGAYAARVQFRVLRGDRLAAARDGKRIKEALETALRLDPSLEDANFGLGLYQYYADVAPAAAKVLRWLLLLPGGDRSEGLARMLRAADRGQLVRGEADFQLHLLYLWYERDFPTALNLVEQLEKRFPANPLFPRVLAEIHDAYLHDPTASAKAYDHLLRLARRHLVHEAPLAEAHARLGLANQLETLFESDRALEHAQALIAQAPLAPYSTLAAAHVAAARALGHLGRAEEARTALTRALALTPQDDPLGLRHQVQALQRTRTSAVSAEAYRQSLEGYRAYQRRAFAEADTALAAAVAVNPNDMVARYRYGLLLKARGREPEARQQWQTVADSGATTPAAIFAEACTALALATEAAGELPQARTLYLRAADTFGAFAETRAAAARHAARLTSALSR